MKKILIIIIMHLTVMSYAQFFAPNESVTGTTNPATGNVGIGNASPSFKLDVSGNLRTTSFITASEYITVGSGGSYRVGMNAQSDGYITGRNASFADKFLISSNGVSYFNGGNVGIGTALPLNKLQIGPNNSNWSGNDLVVSNGNGGLAIYTDPTHTYLIGSKDIAVRPNGKWSLYSKASTGYVGVGFTNPTAMLHVMQSNNTDWAAAIQNGGGSGKGLLVKSGSGIGEFAPILQLEDNLGANRFVVRSDGKVGVGTTTPKQNFHVKGRIFLEGTEAYPSGWLQNYFHWRGHSLIMGSEPGEYAHNTIELKPGGSASGVLESYFQMFTSTAPGTHLQKVQFATNGVSWMNGGNVGIGTTTPSQKLTVNGTVYSTEVKVDVNAGTGPDYVFEPTYILPTLAETETYIKANKHLPEVPSAKEMEANGINLSEMNMLLLKKVEELTLYQIEAARKIELLESQVQKLIKKEGK